ncbi:MAG: CGNR zinc finger domain-containing protein [Gemmatimonadetes bacterium]|nr:CGNR zinc finger domain-containing protein [Gemmatimonadota bacterium]
MKSPDLVFDGGHLALDFLNTEASPDGERDDLLSAPTGLLAWLEGAGLAATPDLALLMASPPEARVLLAHATRLRTAVAEMVQALVSGTPAPPLPLMEVNRILAERTAGLRLESDPTGYRLVSTSVSARSAGLLAPVAEAAARLLTDADPARVRRCDAPGCSLWFLDTSRNGRRRWCSMARCGNRAKVAAHYRRGRRLTRRRRSAPERRSPP